MGYKVKIQLVQRQGTHSYYINFPVAVAAAIGLEKGEEWHWLLEDKNTLILKRMDEKALAKEHGKRAG